MRDQPNSVPNGDMLFLSAVRADVEKVVVLPLCWHSTTLSRLSPIVGLEALRAHRQMLLDGLDEKIDALAALAMPVESEVNDAIAAMLDTRVRKHLDILAVLVENFARSLSMLVRVSGYGANT